MPNAEADLIVGRAYKDNLGGGTFIWDGKNKLPAVRDPTTGKLVVDRQGLVSTGTPGAIQMTPKLNPSDEEALKQLQTEAIQKRLLATRAQQFMAIQGGPGPNGVPTGPVYSDTSLFGLPQMIPNVAKSLHDAFDPNTAVGKMDAINRATWAMTRPKGAGPIRSYESGDWKMAFPNTSNYGPVNGNITQRLVGDANDGESLMKFVSDYVSQGRGPAAAAIAEYQRQKQNAALQQRSAQARVPQGGMTVDINGQPVGQ